MNAIHLPIDDANLISKITNVYRSRRTRTLKLSVQITTVVLGVMSSAAILAFRIPGSQWDSVGSGTGAAITRRRRPRKSVQLCLVSSSFFLALLR